MIQALVFDFDGLILDTESAIITAYAHVHEKHGVPFDRGLFQRSVGHGEYAFDPLHGFPKDADRAALEAERRALNLQADLQLTILPGVMDLFDAARAHGLRVALASNSSHAHCEKHLARIGLLDRFDFLACREDAALPKPAPDLYQLVLTHFGLRGFQAIAFEDSHTGSLAAKRANLWCIAAPNPATQHHDFRHVDRVVGSLADCTLPDLLTAFKP